MIEPIRRDDGSLEAHYDDFMILEFASRCDGVVVSNDKFRDVFVNYPNYRTTRLLPFAFAEDEFLPVLDPRGRNGPKLEDYIKF